MDGSVVTHHCWRVLLLLTVAIVLHGCATLGQRVWGAHVTFTPGAQRMRDAAVLAVKSPRVWVPLAGAAVFQINGWDRKVSNWARENTPVFGSQQNADDWSDRLCTASSVAYFGTVLATPGPDELDDWLRDKGHGLTVGLGAIAVTDLATSALKDTTKRTRPNGEGTQSFPSGHTSHSAVMTGLASDNLAYIDMPDSARRGLIVGLDALTVGTAWARVEAGAHFPADTLAGMALGRAVSTFFDAAFLEGPDARRVAWSVIPTRGGVELQWEMAF